MSDKRLPWISPAVLMAGGDEQPDPAVRPAADLAAVAAVAAGFDLRQHAQDLERQVEALTANAAERDFYRDSLRRILGVTQPDGEALIALVEVGLYDARLQAAGIVSAADVCTAIEEHLAIERTDPDEPLHERLTRVGLVMVEVLDARRRADLTLKRWQARARKAEGRIRVLSKMAEERDGLTLRVGAKVARQIRRMPRNTFDAAVNERINGRVKRKGGCR